MHSFELLSEKFNLRFDRSHFPGEPASLYEPNDYFLKLGGKRIRPVLSVMGNELFGDIIPDAWEVATAIELFHNFTLIHDDMMDKAPLRRGMQTLHSRYGNSTALLAGDVMLVAAYEYINKIDNNYLSRILKIFNDAARQVCEGQQLDMDFEKKDRVMLDEYLHMISLKTSVLLAASLKMGAILGGGGERNQNLLFEFGKKLGIAFQVQDDYLDAFGDPTKFGKQVGGDILSNKKTFLLLHAREAATPVQQKELALAMSDEGEQKISRVLSIYRDCKVDEWAIELKNKYIDEAVQHLEDIAVLSKRKQPLADVADFLVKREH
jgi:geranylgeranyl diphosphate synthase type II